MTVLSFGDVTVRYGRGAHQLTAVDGVDLDVPRGAIVGLVGESGSGKSTLARTAVGLAPITGGTVTVDGTDAHDLLQARRRPVQLVFQDATSALDPRLSIGRSIAEALPPRRSRGRDGERARVAELLELVGLEPARAGDRPGQLSGGQRQRVALARALAAEPDYLLADEITSALDVSVQGAVLNLLRELQRELGFGVLFISHNLAVVRYVSDHLAVMYLGQVVESGPTTDVLEAPTHPYTQSLVAAIPQLGEPLDARRSDSSTAMLDVDPPEPHDPPSGCRFHTRCPVGPAVFANRQVCGTRAPSLIVVGDAPDHRAPGHLAACHFAGPAPVGPPSRKQP